MTYKKYISEVIGDEYKEWKKGDMILIKSPTGSGKSEFIKKQLLSWCNKYNKSMLLLSNRTMLYKQQINDIKLDSRYNNEKIELSLYQKFDGEINNYDYVVCDECHYFYEDSSFNRHTDILFKDIQKFRDGIIVLLSATPELVEKRLGEIITKKYALPFSIKNYSLYKYWNRKTVPMLIKDIIEKYPEDKILYFCSSAKESYRTSQLFKDSAFICSKRNTEYATLINKEESKNIEENSKYNCKLLCVTTALDNGINIKDTLVKHIIIDVFTPVATVQCLGRKRLISDDEHLNIYIKDCGNGYLKRKLLNCDKNLAPYLDFISLSKIEFAKKYNKKFIGKILDLICNNSGCFDYEANECMRDWYVYVKDFCNMCIETKGLYFTLICGYLGLPSDYQDIIEDIEYEKLEFVMNKWIDKHIFNNTTEREQFINDVYEAVESKNIDSRLKGLNTMNKFLEELELPYIVQSKAENSRKSENRGKYYWIIKKIE